MSDLPLVDEHTVTADASAAAVWQALASGFARAGVPAAYARVVGCVPASGSGRWPETGSTVPGFAVDEADPGRLLRLVGRHRFSRYRLDFVLTEGPGAGTTTLTAVTYAEFPGLLGRAYRLAVIGSRGHRLIVGGMLARIARRAEA